MENLLGKSIKPMLARLWFIFLSGCSLVVGGETTNIDDASIADASFSDSSIDSSLDSSIDAAQPICSIYTDEGCEEGFTCKGFIEAGCTPVLNERGEFESCSFVSDCATGLGCYMAECRYYCEPNDECPNGTCTTGYCI